ncbi:hypothetical protein EDB83DRAFT_2400089 [Lactarius deliciosus]|nr:hypothetical protein EDB83DRAFT_2400089 [Lactarius deliciosus]
MSGAGRVVSSGSELESHADGLGTVSSLSSSLLSKVRSPLILFPPPELTSRDHSATWIFMHTRRLYPGSGLRLANELQPGSARPYHLPHPPLCPTFFPFIDKRWTQSRSVTIRGPRLCRRCLEELAMTLS